MPGCLMRLEDPGAQIASTLGEEKHNGPGQGLAKFEAKVAA